MPIPLFQKIPTIGYDITGSGEKILAVDILQRMKMRDILLNDYLIFYTYHVKDGETPEMIANKLYGNTQYHWIVLLANNIVDPFYDWPMSHENLILTMRKKYDTPVRDGLVYAYQTIHHYEDLRKNVIDEVTYRSLPAAERNVIMIYDEEVANNEAKRTVRLLDKRFVAQIENEANTIMQRRLV